jgi:hypothetical protein
MGPLIHHHFCKGPSTLPRKKAHKVIVLFLLKSPIVYRWIQNCEIVFHLVSNFALLDQNWPTFRTVFYVHYHQSLARKNTDFYCFITLDGDVLEIWMFKDTRNLERKRVSCQVKKFAIFSFDQILTQGSVITSDTTPYGTSAHILCYLYRAGF